MIFYKYLFTGIILHFISVISFAQETDSTAKTIDFIAYWAPGDIFEFEVSRIKQTWKDGKETKNDSATYQAILTVLNETDSNYTLQWQYVFDPKVNLQSILPSFTKDIDVLREIKVIYQTDELGAFINIINFEEIKEALTAAFTSLINQIDEKSLSKAQKEALTILIQAMTSEAGINENAYREIHLLHWPFGVSFDPEDTVFYDDELPNLFGGEPLASEGAIYFDEYDFEEEYCVIINHMWPNSDDVHDMLIDFFKSILGDASELEEIMKTAEAEIEDSRYMAYYYNPGIPLYLSYIREVMININGEVGQNEDRTIIKLVDYKPSDESEN